MTDEPNHGPDDVNPPGRKPPRLMDLDELKRTYRTCMRDIADGRVEIIDDSVTKDTEELFDLAFSCERQLRRRGEDPESVASEELLRSSLDDQTGAED